MFSGAHIMLYSNDAEADRAVFRGTLGLDCADAGGGWLIFALPPSELRVHPAEGASTHAELYLMCDDLPAAIERLASKGVKASPPQQEGWGSVTQVKLPSGAQLGIYQPRHARPAAAG